MKKPHVIQGLFAEDIHSEIKEFVTNYSKYLAAPKDDLFQRYYKNDVPFFENIHQQLTKFASEIFQTEVKPSYSFLSMYHNGGTCPLHIDRRQCRFTIDYLIQQDSTEPWPICISDELTDVEVEAIDVPDKGFSRGEPGWDRVIAEHQWTTVNLNPNDAVCYSGTNSWHYRPEILNGTADLVFFHFVPVEFTGSLK